MMGLMLAAASSAGPLLAAVVTVNVTDQAKAPVEGTVVVFDPLDDLPPPARNTAVIDQIDKRFSPRISVIRTGTAVAFPNSDHIRHQVYSFSPAHPFNLKLYAGSPRMEEVFALPGLVILGCNIHDTMVAFVAVVDSPYFAKVAASGTAEVNLPPGRYRLRVWHPNVTSALDPQQLSVGAAPMTIPISLDIDPSRETPATWPE